MFLQFSCVMTFIWTFDLDLDMKQGLICHECILMTNFYYKVKVKGQDLDHYPAKLLKHYRFVQNVFTFFMLKQCQISYSIYYCNQTPREQYIPCNPPNYGSCQTYITQYP